MVLPYERTSVPGVYRRGSKYVVVSRVDGRQRKETADTFAEAQTLKRTRAAEARALRRGPTLHSFGLEWLDAYAGTGHDALRENTRQEYRRLLVTFALEYFDGEVRMGDLDRRRLQGFVDWLTSKPGRHGRLKDSSIANIITPLRLVLDSAVAHGLIASNPAEQVVLPRRRRGRAWSMQERRFLTRVEIKRLRAEVPEKWQPLFALLAATGLRISEAIGLRWSDLTLDGPVPHLHVHRAFVRGMLVAPKSRHGARTIPVADDLASELQAYRPADAHDDAYVFPGRAGAPADQGSLRRRVLVPAADRAGLRGVGFHTLRHSCASLLIADGRSALELQRWMGHHSAAFTYEVYGHLLDGELGPPLDLGK